MISSDDSSSISIVCTTLGSDCLLSDACCGAFILTIVDIMSFRRQRILSSLK